MDHSSNGAIFKPCSDRIATELYMCRKTDEDLVSSVRVNLNAVFQLAYSEMAIFEPGLYRFF